MAGENCNGPARSSIVHLIDSGGFFGAEQVIVALACEQQRNGNEVVVATILAPEDAGNPLGDIARQCGLSVHEFTMSDGFSRTGLREILQWVRHRGVDVVHCHGYKANIFLGLVGKRRRNWQQVTTLHGWTSTRRFSKMWLYEQLERIALRNFDAICVVSDTMRQRLPPSLASRRWVSTVRNGVDMSVVSSPLPADIEAFAAGRAIIVAIGRLSREKDFATLIAAMEIVCEEHPAACLVLVGEGPEADALATQVRASGIGSAVFFAGYRDQPRRWLEHCALLAVSSRTEGLPMVVLESLAAGTPIVSTCVGAIPQVLDGLDSSLVPVGDCRALARAISRLLKREDSERARELRRERVEAHYSATAMATEYSAIYESLATRAVA